MPPARRRPIKCSRLTKCLVMSTAASCRAGQRHSTWPTRLVRWPACWPPMHCCATMIMRALPGGGGQAWPRTRASGREIRGCPASPGRARTSSDGARLSPAIAQIDDELRAGKWPGLSARLQSIGQAERHAHAAIGVRAIAEAIRKHRTPSGQARPRPAIVQATEPGVTEPEASGLPGSEHSLDAAAVERRVRQGRRERAERAGVLVAGCGPSWPRPPRRTPPGPPATAAVGQGACREPPSPRPAKSSPPAPPPGSARRTGAPVLTPGYETELARRTGPDLFGLLRLPDPPPFLASLRPETLRPRPHRPLLRRISMTRPPPDPADLRPAALTADPGPVSTHHRTPASAAGNNPPAPPHCPPPPPSPTSSTASGSADPSRPTPPSAPPSPRPPPPTPTTTSPSGPTSTAPPSDAADAAPPPPPGTPDPHAPHRDMLTWARQNNIHLINVHEIFHHARPMTLHRQYTAEHNKQLPRGYAGASDHLRLDIIHLLGGTYLDGDNHITTTDTAPAHPLTHLTRRRSRITPRLHPPHAPRRHQQRPHHRPRPPPRHHPLARTGTSPVQPQPARAVRRPRPDDPPLCRQPGNVVAVLGRAQNRPGSSRHAPGPRHRD